MYKFFCACYRICPKKKTATKNQRWEEKLFSALVDKNGIGVDERIMEIKLAYYYQNMDTEDLVMAGSISDIENGYLLSDLVLSAHPSHLQVLKVNNWIRQQLLTIVEGLMKISSTKGTCAFDT